MVIEERFLLKYIIKHLIHALFVGDSPSKAVFGLDLAEHLRISNRRIAFPLELCIRALTELGLSEEGLFRVVGG